MLKTENFIKKFHLNIPLIQAPMAGITTPALAAHVCNTGAIGSLGLGSSSLNSAAQMIKELKSLTNKAFNLNFFCHKQETITDKQQQKWLETLQPEFMAFSATPPPSLQEIYPSFYKNDALLKLVLDEKPAIASFHFGMPDAEAICAMKQAGIYLIATATNLTDAQDIQKAGFDAVIAQGYEAGGHRGMFDENALDDRLGLMALLPLLSANLSIPIIAAGGIMNGTAIAAVLQLGAMAAQMGTAFIACPESSADKNYRKMLSSDAAFHTLMTRVISGRPARALPNRFTALFNQIDDNDIAPYPFAYDAAKQLNTLAKKHGDIGYGAFWAGQGAPFAQALPTKLLIEQLIEQFLSSKSKNY